jgi:hypothetical protein
MLASKSDFDKKPNFLLSRNTFNVLFLLNFLSVDLSLIPLDISEKEL